ncbi:MAG: helix-turn-helix transcriptional regulator [Bacteroidetes bacterium]|nr:helix-turn-helix transcriptional regulator [Bacteroidota bacterium]
MRNEEFVKAFGEHLRYLRKASGLSQEKLSYAADVPLSQIGRIERGEVNPTISTIYSISKALRVSPQELLAFELAQSIPSSAKE